MDYRGTKVTARLKDFFFFDENLAKKIIRKNENLAKKEAKGTNTLLLNSNKLEHFHQLSFEISKSDMTLPKSALSISNRLPAMRNYL